jgi:hypothetical protein
LSHVGVIPHYIFLIFQFKSNVTVLKDVWVARQEVGLKTYTALQSAHADDPQNLSPDV